MIEVLSTPQNRLRTFILLVVCCSLAIAAGALFLIAIFVSPTGALVGVVGAAVMSRRERKLQTVAPPV